MQNLSLLEIDYNKLKKNLEILPLGQLLYIENKFLVIKIYYFYIIIQYLDTRFIRIKDK